MQIKSTAGIIAFGFIYFVSTTLVASPVKDSSEDLFWTDPMTIHDYKKDTDLHNIAASAFAFTELEFVRLGDGIIGLVARNNKSPISKSLDSLEYAYSRLPRVQPVRRFGQFWDALQLRQISLSDARLANSFIGGDSLGGVTPLMQVRVYMLVVLLEDILYDMDNALMSPVNWGASSLRKKPVRVKSLGYVADGVGYFRWQISAGLKRINREVIRVSSKAITMIEKSQDAMTRRKRKKQNQHVQIYSKMPLSVFMANRDYFKNKKHTAMVSTVQDWRDRIYRSPLALPDNIRQENFSMERLSTLDPSQEVIIATPYALWEKTPRALKKYVITSEELDEAMREGMTK